VPSLSNQLLKETIRIRDCSRLFAMNVFSTQFPEHRKQRWNRGVRKEGAMRETSSFWENEEKREGFAQGNGSSSGNQSFTSFSRK
jgi:hypothetical protein